jgi:hypothetical protein
LVSGRQSIGHDGAARANRPLSRDGATQNCAVE